MGSPMYRGKIGKIIYKITFYPLRSNTISKASSLMHCGSFTAITA